MRAACICAHQQVDALVQKDFFLILLDISLVCPTGVLPMNFTNQIAAERLAICNDIGEAAYVSSSVAAVLMERIRCLPSQDAIQRKVVQRLRLAFEDTQTGEDYVDALATFAFQGDKEQAAVRIINQFRRGFLGKFALELTSDDRRQH